jgi:hypothetical protein
MSRFTNLGVGFYQVRVDSGDCNEVSMLLKLPLRTNYTTNKTDVTCNGENNGELIVGSGGTGKLVIQYRFDMTSFF